jgi:hypothetical protein
LDANFPDNCRLKKQEARFPGNCTTIVAAERLTDNQPMPDRAELFPAEALPENRAGHLTSDQAGRFQRMVAGRRQSTRGVALPVGAIGALLLIMSGPAATAVKRHLAGWGFLAAAAAILAAPAFDPLAADAREGRVEVVEGAIGKKRLQSVAPTRGARYYLNIGGRQLRTYLSAYDAAPDAGYVRAYYLPRTARLVNLERLPNPPLPAGPDEARGMFARMARAFATGDPVAFAEARANAAGLLDAAQESIREPSAAASRRAAGGLVRETLVGTWTHPLVTVVLAEDGAATVTTIAGSTEAGHWSVDGHGRLLTDTTGTMEPTDAVLDGGRLTIELEGRRLTFTRAADA